MRNKGFSQKVIDRMSMARSCSTNKVYRSKWRLFEQFCTDRNLDAFQASAPTVADFLTFCFETREAQPATLQGYRSAIGAVLKLSAGFNPGQDDILSQLIKSFFRERPVRDKTFLSWDVNLVLHYLKHGKLGPSANLSLRDLTLKTVFLLALATGKRCCEIHALDNNLFRIQGDWASVSLKPRADFIGKTHFTTRGAGTFTEIILPALYGAPGANLQDLSICPVHTLRCYRHRTSEMREGKKRLIISFMQNKTSDITKRTIANYLKWLVEEAYSAAAKDTLICDTFKMRPHDVRGVAITLKACTNVAMADILAAGVWSSMSTFLRFYVKEFSHDDITKLYSIGPFVAAGSVFNK